MGDHSRLITHRLMVNVRIPCTKEEVLRALATLVGPPPHQVHFLEIRQRKDHAVAEVKFNDGMKCSCMATAVKFFSVDHTQYNSVIDRVREVITWLAPTKLPGLELIREISSHRYKIRNRREIPSKMLSLLELDCSYLRIRINWKSVGIWRLIFK